MFDIHKGFLTSLINLKMFIYMQKLFESLIVMVTYFSQRTKHLGNYYFTLIFGRRNNFHIFNQCAIKKKMKKWTNHLQEKQIKVLPSLSGKEFFSVVSAFFKQEESKSWMAFWCATCFFSVSRSDVPAKPCQKSCTRLKKKLRFTKNIRHYHLAVILNTMGKTAIGNKTMQNAS